jgi:hypothetical protein
MAPEAGTPAKKDIETPGRNKKLATEQSMRVQKSQHLGLLARRKS